MGAGSDIWLSLKHAPSTKYLALSYCWGVPRIFSTTRQNLDEHLENIPWSSLPKTFLQAIEVTRSLGYDYIWIDSLCIIQQDEVDFAQQSSQMGDVYPHADAVISADSASDVHQGFFGQRNYATTTVEVPKSKLSQDVPSLQHETVGSSEKLTTFYVRQVLGADGREIHWGLGKNATSQRAWW